MRKKLWRSRPYGWYISLYQIIIETILSLNRNNVKIIFINGMRRSGNHYLMKTIMDSATSSIVFYNNQKMAQVLDIRNGVQVKIRFSKKILLIIGYEDLFIDDYLASCNYILNKSFLDVENIKLLILRDIRNIMSSRLNHAHMASQLRKDKKALEFSRELWYNHHYFYQNNNFIKIRYNHLKSDLTGVNLERFFILNLNESIKVLNRYGGGSSFENHNFNNRYLNFSGDDIYESLIKNFKELDEDIHGSWRNQFKAI